MSSKTKIVVLHMKEILYTGIFAILGIFLIVLLFILFLPDAEETPTEGSPETEMTESSTDMSASLYIPGLYNTELILNDQTINVEVIVDAQKITSLQLANLSDSIAAMYPLLEPTFDSLAEQILSTQSLEDISYSQDSRYTSLVLLEAISKALEKAQP